LATVEISRIFKIDVYPHIGAKSHGRRFGKSLGYAGP
jgi:hypothetical protein